MEPATRTVIDRYHFIPLDEAQKPPRNTMLYHWSRRYWIVHPEHGVAFWNKGYSSPQCNGNEELARRFAPPWAQIVYIDSVFAPLNLRDYQE